MIPMAVGSIAPSGATSENWATSRPGSAAQNWFVGMFVLPEADEPVYVVGVGRELLRYQCYGFRSGRPLPNG